MSITGLGRKVIHAIVLNPQDELCFSLSESWPEMSRPIEEHRAFFNLPRKLWLLAVVVASLLVIGVSAIGSQALTISRVSTDRWGFNPGSGEEVTIRYHLSQKARVTVRVFDSRDILIRTLAKEQTQQPGDQQVVWDGKDEAGREVVPGLYVYTINAQTRKGLETLFDLTDITGGEEQGAEAVYYDHTNTEISYVLPKPGLVNIRYGLRDGGPLLGTLVDWVPRPAGLNREPWDGFVANRAIEVAGNPKLEIMVSSYTLSSNSIVVLGNTRTLEPEFIERISWPEERRENLRRRKKRMYYHWQHPRDKCRDPQLEVIFSDAPVDKSGLPLIMEKTPIRITIAEEDRDFMMGERFEIVIYVDMLFVYEEELGYIPFNWTWDPVGVSPGIHYITVMLRGYEGHFGTATRKVLVRK
jgi:hypothetical protein